MKKFLALVTLVCMVLTSTAAMASAVPSKTADDLTQVEIGTTETGVAVEPTFTVAVVEENETIAAEIEAMRAVVAEEKAVAEYFPAEVKEEIAAALPAEATVETAVVYELVPMTANEYKEEYGDVEVKIAVATAFADETELVVLLGLPKADGVGMDWTVKSGVVENGMVKVLFTQEELVQMETVEALIVVMGAPMA